MEFLENIFKRGANFFIDNQHAITKRLGVGLIILALGFIIDDQIGFTYYYSTNQKIVQTEKLTNVIVNDSTDAEAVRELKKLRLQVLQRKGIISHLWDLTKSAINSRSTQTAKATPANIIDSRRSIFLHVLSSSWALIILALVGFMGIMLQKKIGGNEIAAIVLLLMMMGLIVIFFSFAFSYIPILFGDPVYNYILNAILHLILVVVVVRIIGKKS